MQRVGHDGQGTAQAFEVLKPVIQHQQDQRCEHGHDQPGGL
jgi:hypothetical protein